MAKIIRDQFGNDMVVSDDFPDMNLTELPQPEKLVFEPTTPAPITASFKLYSLNTTITNGCELSSYMVVPGSIRLICRVSSSEQLSLLCYVGRALAVVLEASGETAVITGEKGMKLVECSSRGKTGMVVLKLSSYTQEPKKGT